MHLKVFNVSRMKAQPAERVHCKYAHYLVSEMPETRNRGSQTRSDLVHLNPSITQLLPSVSGDRIVTRSTIATDETLTCKTLRD